MRHYQEPQNTAKRKTRSWILFPLLTIFICAIIIVFGIIMMSLFALPHTQYASNHMDSDMVSPCPEQSLTNDTFWIHMNPILNATVGDHLNISGITNLPLGEKLQVSIHPAALNDQNNKNISQYPATLTPPPLTPLITTQNPTSIVSATVVPSGTPHFSGTISVRSDKLTAGSNLSSPLTEDQAWKYADIDLANFGIFDIKQDDITSLGQGKYTYENNTQTWTWGFHIRRCVVDVGCHGVANIIIDANNGNLIDFAPLD